MLLRDEYFLLAIRNESQIFPSRFQLRPERDMRKQNILLTMYLLRDRKHHLCSTEEVTDCLDVSEPLGVRYVVIGGVAVRVGATG